MYEYLRYVKEDLDYFKNNDNRNKVNSIKAIICNDFFSKITEDYINQKDLLDRTESLVDCITTAKKKKDVSVEEKRVYEEQVSVKRRINKYEKTLSRMQQYLFHYHAMLRNWNCSYAIIFENNEVWSINYTRSLRKDRIDTHMARFAHLISDRNYLVVSEYSTQDEQSRALIHDLKTNPLLFGTAVYIVSFEELLDEIMCEIFKYKRDTSGELRYVSMKKEKSVVNGLRGVEIEKIYARCLSNQKNFDCYIRNKSGSKSEETKGTFLPNEYAAIMDYILKDKRIPKSKVKSVETDDIGSLKLKPDVYVRIFLIDGREIKSGISIKSTDEDTVSFHEKKAEDFIKVLKISDRPVKEALISFQEKKAISKLSKAEEKALTRYFENDNNRKNLIKWAVMGATDDRYKAQYVLTHRYNNEGDSIGIEIRKAKEYVEYIFDNSVGKSFNSGFSWTYKSVIQLKGPVVQD